MKRIFSIFIVIMMAISCHAKEKLRVLYVGGTPDINTIGTPPVDSVVLEQSIRERSNDFSRFLKKHFTHVSAINGKDYTPEMSKSYDVTIFDGKPKVSSSDDALKTSLLPFDFDCAAILIAEMSEVIGNPIGSKNDWFCLCLDNYALGWKKDHPIFNGPFKVNIVPERRPIPKTANEYSYIYGYTLPLETEMWKVHESTGYENGQRIGMVSRPWGYTDSPDTEIISGGQCAKSIDAIAIGRHGNLFHWGFAAKPSDMTDAAQATFANAIVYMKDFNGQHPIARKLNENIATRDNVTAAKYYASRECWKEMEKTNMRFYLSMDSLVKSVKAKMDAGKEITPMEAMTLQMPLQKPQPIPFSKYLKDREPELYKIFGDDETEYARYYDKNRPYFIPDKDGYRLEIDQEARALGIANNDIRILDKAIELLENGGEDAVTGRTLLERYTLCRFATPAEWKAWLDANRDRMFFTESGGWLWLVDTLDPTVPGNDYSVLTACTTPVSTESNVLPEATDRENPVAIDAYLSDTTDGEKEVVLTMTVHDGFHTYAIVDSNDPFIPTEIDIQLPDGYKKHGELITPAQSPSATATTYYTGSGTFRQRISGEGKGTIICKVSYQACDASMCMPPVTKTFNLEI